MTWHKYEKVDRVKYIDTLRHNDENDFHSALFCIFPYSAYLTKWAPNMFLPYEKPPDSLQKYNLKDDTKS